MRVSCWNTLQVADCQWSFGETLPPFGGLVYPSRKLNFTGLHRCYGKSQQAGMGSLPADMGTATHHKPPPGHTHDKRNDGCFGYYICNNCVFSQTNPVLDVPCLYTGVHGVGAGGRLAEIISERWPDDLERKGLWAKGAGWLLRLLEVLCGDVVCGSKRSLRVKRKGRIFLGAC